MKQIVAGLMVALVPNIGIAQEECGTIQSSLERLDCYDSYFLNPKAAELPDEFRVRDDLIGHRLLDPYNNAIGVGRRFWDIGSLDQFASWSIISKRVENDIAQYDVRVNLGPHEGNYWSTTAVMVYRLQDGQWHLKHVSTKENFTLIEAR